MPTFTERVEWEILRRINEARANPREALESRGFMALYADSMFLGIQGILDCGCVEPADIGAAVAQIEGFQGLSGEITYAGTNGIPPKAVPINQIIDGQDVLVATVGLAGPGFADDGGAAGPLGQWPDFDPIGFIARDSLVEAPQFRQSRFYYWKNRGGSDVILFIGDDQPWVQSQGPGDDDAQGQAGPASQGGARCSPSGHPR